MTTEGSIALRVGQTWERKTGGRRVRVELIYIGDRVEVAAVDGGRTSRPLKRTLRRDYRLIEDAT